MPHDYTVDLPRRLVHLRMWGAVTSGDIKTASAALAAEDRLSPEFAELIDLRELTSVDAISSQDIRAIAAARLTPCSRRAFVAPDPATFGLVRMFAALRDLREGGEQIGVFRTIGEAGEWLGLELR